MSFVTGTHSIRRRSAICHLILARCAWQGASCKTYNTSNNPWATALRNKYPPHAFEDVLDCLNVIASIVHLWLLVYEGVSESKRRSFLLHLAVPDLISHCFSPCVSPHRVPKWREAVTYVAMEVTVLLIDTSRYRLIQYRWMELVTIK